MKECLLVGLGTLLVSKGWFDAAEAHEEARELNLLICKGYSMAAEVNWEPRDLIVHKVTLHCSNESHQRLPQQDHQREHCHRSEQFWQHYSTCAGAATQLSIPEMMVTTAVAVVQDASS